MKIGIQMRKLLALLLALLLVSCNVPTETPQDTSTTEAPSTTAPAAQGLSIITDGTANYRIVRGEKAPKNMTEAAIQVRKMISDATGVTPEISTDWVKKGSEHDHTSLEILVGPTDYSESTEALKDVPYGDYIITQVGNKIVINAWSADALTKACNAFRSLVRDHRENDDLILPADLRVTGTGNKLVNQLPNCDSGTLSSIYDAGNDTWLIILEDTTPDDYSAYLQKLASSGYTLYAQNDITDNHFATYINDAYVINAGYYAYEKAIRATVEPRNALPPRAEDNSYEKKVQPSVTQFGLAYPSYDGETIASSGQGQAFQLSDGSFIIVDGGLKRDIDAKQIYEYLYANAPDPNSITIAAWIITHAHSDHTGAYEVFTSTYASKVKLELLICNFPSETAKVESGLGEDAGPSGDRIPGSLSAYPGAKLMKAHVGQEYFLRDAKVEILYTLESLAPAEFTYNTSSLIFKLELGGQTFLMLADATQDACRIAYSMYGDYLKSDFVQAAHHGFGVGSSVYTGVTSVYSAAAAPVVLWPCSDDAFSTMNDRAASRHLIELDSTKEIFVAGDRIIRLLLPYTAGTSGQESILK